MLVPVNHPLLYTKIYCYITASTTAVIRQIAHLKFSSSGLLTRLLDWYPIVLLENTLKNQQVVSVRVLRVMENSKDVGPFYPPSWPPTSYRTYTSRNDTHRFSKSHLRCHAKAWHEIQWDPSRIAPMSTLIITTFGYREGHLLANKSTFKTVPFLGRLWACNAERDQMRKAGIVRIDVQIFFYLDMRTHLQLSDLSSSLLATLTSGFTSTSGRMTRSCVSNSRIVDSVKFEWYMQG